MGNTLNPQAWSTNPDDNDDADAGINWLEGQFPATVNNSGRGSMAAQKKFILDLCGAPAAVGGTADAHTVTTNQALSADHITDGLQISYRAPGTNTIANPTLAVDGTTAATLKRNDGTALAVGSITSGMILIVQRQATVGEYWILNIGPAVSDSGSMNINGLSSILTPSFYFDYLPIYNVDVFANKKVAPRWLVPSNWASFSVHRNGTNQTITSTNLTAITWTTEALDQGSNFSASGWTPPAGTVQMNLVVEVQAGTGEQVILHILKDGAAFKEYKATVVSGSLPFSMAISVIDVASSGNFYTAAIESTDSSYTVIGTAVGTYWTGSMI